MRIAVYGGSFNPPHVAHAMVAAWLLWTDQVDEVWLVPVFRHAFEPWHGKTLAPFERRVAWCAAMAADIDPRVRVSDVERTLPTPSFTVETLRALREANPGDHFRLVVGADVLPTLPKWRDWASIAQEFEPIVVGRDGYPSPAGAVRFPEVSSTEIRERLERGEAVGALLTRSVARMLALELS